MARGFSLTTAALKRCATAIGTCVSLPDLLDLPDSPGFPAPPALPIFLLATGLSLREKKRQAFEGDGQIHAFQLYLVGHLQRAGREIQNGFDARCDDQVEDVLRGSRGDGNHGDADAVAPRDL